MSRSPDLDVAALRSDPKVAWTHDTIRFADTDLNGHVNNSAFSVYCESGRVPFLHEALKGFRAAGGYFVIARLLIEFRAELHYPGRVHCGTWLDRVGRSSLTLRQVLLDDAGRLAATSEAVTVGIDGETRRPAQLDDGTRRAVEALLRR